MNIVHVGITIPKQHTNYIKNKNMTACIWNELSVTVTVLVGLYSANISSQNLCTFVFVYRLQTSCITTHCIFCVIKSNTDILLYIIIISMHVLTKIQAL